MKIYRLVILVLVVLLIVSTTALANVPDVKTDRGIRPDYYICTVTSTTTAYMKTAAACNLTMVPYGWPVTVGTAVSQSQTQVCGINYRKIIGGTFSGKYVMSGATQCVWHD